MVCSIKFCNMFENESLSSLLKKIGYGASKTAAYTEGQYDSPEAFLQASRDRMERADPGAELLDNPDPLTSRSTFGRGVFAPWEDVSPRESIITRHEVDEYLSYLGAQDRRNAGNLKSYDPFATSLTGLVPAAFNRGSGGGTRDWNDYLHSISPSFLDSRDTNHGNWGVIGKEYNNVHNLGVRPYRNALRSPEYYFMRSLGFSPADAVSPQAIKALQNLTPPQRIRSDGEPDTFEFSPEQQKEMAAIRSLSPMLGSSRPDNRERPAPVRGRKKKSSPSLSRMLGIYNGRI